MVVMDSNGLIFGNVVQSGLQCIAVLATIVYTFIGTYILLKIVDKLFGLRVSVDDELKGLDISQHNEGAYNLYRGV